ALLRASPPEIDFPLDKNGGTALLYAAVWARVPILVGLLASGANPDPPRDAREGRTILMEAVNASNNYDAQTFPEVLRALRRTLTDLDGDGRSLLHHVARIGFDKKKWNEVNYYARCIIEYLQEAHRGAPEGVAAYVDMQDRRGDTALHLACKSANRVMVAILLKAGAVQDLPNRDG
ncbi:ankyrin repeat-containing domain protein, partial [Blyttiomyces helicus]